VPTTRFPSTRVEVPAFFTSAAVRQLPRDSTAFGERGRRPQPNEPGWVGFFFDLLGRGPARVGGVDVWLHVDGQRVARGA
jgi:hypothetical protein